MPPRTPREHARLPEREGLVLPPKRSGAHWRCVSARCRERLVKAESACANVLTGVTQVRIEGGRVTARCKECGRKHDIGRFFLALD